MNTIQKAIAIVDNLDVNYPIELSSEEIAYLHLVNDAGNKFGIALQIEADSTGDAVLEIYKGNENDITKMVKDGASIDLVNGTNLIDIDSPFLFLILKITCQYSYSVKIKSANYIVRS